MCLLRRRLVHDGDLLKLLHRLDTLRESLGRLESAVHLEQVFVHLLKVLVDKLVHNLRGQVDPDVEDSIFTPTLEGL